MMSNKLLNSISVKTYNNPGALLHDMIEKSGSSQTTLAKLTGFSRRKVCELCANKRRFTAETAVILEKVFNIPASAIMEVASTYELEKIKSDSSFANTLNSIDSL